MNFLVKMVFESLETLAAAANLTWVAPEYDQWGLTWVLGERRLRIGLGRTPNADGPNERIRNAMTLGDAEALALLKWVWGAE